MSLMRSGSTPARPHGGGPMSAMASDRSPLVRSMRRALALLAVAVACATAGGCASTSPGQQGSAPVDRGVAPSGGRQHALTEAHERAVAEPTQAYWPFRAATLELQADSLAHARASLAAALARDPGYVPALALASELDAREGRHLEAARRLEAARADATRFPNGLPPALKAALALHYDALERPDLAAAALASLPPSEREGLGSAVVYLTLRGDAPDSAAALAAAMVRRQPKSAVCQNNYGIARLRAGDPKAARAAFLEAIERDPSLPGPYYNLAILEKYFTLDDDAAAKWFARYRERSTRDPDGLAEAFTKAPAKAVASGKGE
jgi:predicted Zn-dependent protease